MTPLTHTSWSKRFDSTTGRWEIFDSGGNRVCRLRSAKTKLSEPTALANATAIEWTPGLLTAVSQVLEAFGDFELGEHPAISNLRATYEKAAMK